LDTDADIAVFPRWAGESIGIDLKRPDEISEVERIAGVCAVGGLKLPTTYALVDLELGDGVAEAYRWQAGVGFLLDASDECLLGHAGCLCYFDAMFFGARKEVELTWNGSYKDIRLPT
jgi:hypothetical protein